MDKIKLPPEGIFVGSGIYPTDTDTLLCTMIGHYAWQAQAFDPMQMIDRIIEDNQGNLAQIWGGGRGYSPHMKAMWQYALDEVGVDIPKADWDKLENLTIGQYQEVFDKYADRDGAGLERFVREAAKRGIYSCFLYTNSREEWVRKLASENFDWYLGYDFGERYNLSLNDARRFMEVSGNLTLTALAASLVSRVREHVDERHGHGWGNVMATSANFTLDYEVLGGTDIPVVEDFAFPNLNFASGLSRGLYRQHNLPMWGSHLAHEHYAWLGNNDPHRWDLLRAGFYMKYMAGAKMLINESGNWFVEHTLAPDSPKLEVPQTVREEIGILGWKQSEKLAAEHPEKIKPYLEEARKYFPTMDYDCEISRKYRSIISDFWDYVKANGTPEGQPESTIALAKGNNDLTTSRYNHNYALSGLYDIACKNPAWFQCAPERGWQLAREVFFPEVPVLAPYTNFHVSGTPYGQVDVVSFADVGDIGARHAPNAEFLAKQYKALLFAGWNTCSDKQYATLLEYVRLGGTLFISIPQLATNDTRSLDVDVTELVNSGDFSDLCGVRVKGRGRNIYWATVPQGSNALGCTFPRRFGVLGLPLGDIEITDPNLEVLAVDDEEAYPVVVRHKYGKGTCVLLNTWTYPGTLDRDEGPGALLNSSGLLGYIYRAIANANQGHIRITDDTVVPGEECRYVSYSYFPEAGKICLFNVDFDHPHTVWLHKFNMREQITLDGGEFRVVETRKL